MTHSAHPANSSRRSRSNHRGWNTRYAHQEAIDTATDGDTVLVADGTYTGPGNKNLDYAGKAITVRSANGPENCIIDCQDEGRGFHFHGDEGADSIVEGLTITNGYVDGSSSGGYYGGGVYCEYSSPTLTDCMITGNLAGWKGGGVRFDHSNTTLIHCTISANTAGAGGGVSCYSGNPTLTNCTISGNLVAYYYGGGVHCSDSSPTLINCTIVGNSAGWNGGGVYCSTSSPTLTNCTIVGNSAGQDGGGVHCAGSSPTLTNCVLWADTPQEIYVSSGAPTVTHCDVQGGWSGAGNIDADPLFAFADDFHLMLGSPCIDAGTNDPVGGLSPQDADGNGRPLDGDGDSVAVADIGAYEFNRAAASIALSPATFEFFGPEGADNPGDQTLSLRNCGGGTLNWEITGASAWLVATPSSGESSGETDQVIVSVDISGLPHGSYTAVLEVADPQAVNSPRRVVVTAYVTDTFYVPSEYATIQAAIDAAVNGDVVDIADGTYTGPGNKDLDFAAKEITVRSASADPALCIIDCEGNGRGFCFHGGEGADSIVAGLTITNGYADSESPGGSYGGAVYCKYSSPTLSNCTITANTAHWGGGVRCYQSCPTLTNCAITANSAGGNGGGVHSLDGNFTLVNCTITGNSARNGGGVYCSGNPTLTNCTITGNSANDGGGAYCSYGNPRLTNCTITGNSAGEGGGVRSVHSNPTLTNCTISANTAYDNGGGMSCFGGGPTLINCILWDDAPQEIRFASDAPPNVTYCDIEGGWDGTGNIDVNPLFVDPAGTDYHLLPGSPCVDAGTNDPPGGLPLTDFEGDPRPLDGDGDVEPWTGQAETADMGADEVEVPTAPFICVIPIELEFTASAGGPYPNAQTISVWNCGVGTINWQIVEDCSWLTIEPDSGSSTGEVDEVTLNVSTAGLPAGQYVCDFEIVDPEAADSPRTVQVAFNVIGPKICVSPSEFVFTATEGGPNPAEKTLSIWNCDQGTLSWQIVEDCPWLEAHPASGESNGETDGAALSVDVSGLSLGQYDCALDVLDPLASNSPYTVAVTLFVGTTLRVPTDYATIQDAIYAAANGDTVLLADGTYTDAGNKNLDFGGRSITVRSENGPENCIIDCENDGRGFYFHSGENAASVVQGITIRDGNVANDSPGGPYGGGIYCIGSSPTITCCIVSSNHARFYGGGIACDDSEATISHCSFHGNTVAQAGGGIHCYYSDLLISNCTITGNSCGSLGGGVSCEESSPTITDCTISENTSDGAGGGIRCSYESHPVITNCLIVRNTARSDAYPGSAHGGGGVYCAAAGAPTLVQCLIIDNTSATDGGGVTSFDGWHWGPGFPRILDCVIANNIAESGGGVGGSANDATIANSILWGNMPEQLPAGTDPAISYCDVQGGWPGAGNIDADPLFVDPNGGNYHLGLRSPCIDGGDNTAVPPWLLTDLDGNPRFWDDRRTHDTGNPDGIHPIVDMGAYEFGSEGCPDDDGDGFVMICHIPPGHPERARTITVPVQAAAAHLAHGDYCGPCNDEGSTMSFWRELPSLDAPDMATNDDSDADTSLLKEDTP